MTVLEPMDKALDLNYLHDLVLQAIDTEDFVQALSLAEKGKKDAEELELTDWKDKFTELCLQINVAIRVNEDNEFNKFNDDPLPSTAAEDFTILKGIGPSAAQKLTNAGFFSIQQIAASQPEQIPTSSNRAESTSSTITPFLKSSLSPSVPIDIPTFQEKRENSVESKEVARGTTPFFQPTPIPIPTFNHLKETENILKDLNYRLIPHHQFNEIDLLAYKIVSISEAKKRFLLIPIKLDVIDQALVITNESITAQHQKGPPVQSAQELLHARDVLEYDLARGEGFFQFLNRYLKLELSVEQILSRKNLCVISGQYHYSMFVEPILITKTEPYFLERKIPFAYQRSTNLRIISIKQLGDVLRFLEGKLETLEIYTANKSSLQTYQTANASLNRNMRFLSLSVLLYAALLAIMYGAQWYHLLRIFLNLGYAVIAIYSLSIIFLYYRFYLIKKEFMNLLLTPYYQQTIQLEEAELLMLREEVSNEFMEQFSYESLEHPSNSGIPKNLNLNSKNPLSENTVQEQERDTPQPIKEEKPKMISIEQLSGKFDIFLHDTE